MAEGLLIFFLEKTFLVERGSLCGDIAAWTVAQYEYEQLRHYEDSDRVEGNFDILAPRREDSAEVGKSWTAYSPYQRRSV